MTLAQDHKIVYTYVSKADGSCIICLIDCLLHFGVGYSVCLLHFGVGYLFVYLFVYFSFQQLHHYLSRVNHMLNHSHFYSSYSPVIISG